MTEIEATAEIFWTAFKVLPRAEQQMIIHYIVTDQNLRHDLMDLALIEERRNESSRPLRDYIAEHN